MGMSLMVAYSHLEPSAPLFVDKVLNHNPNTLVVV